MPHPGFERGLLNCGSLRAVVAQLFPVNYSLLTVHYSLPLLDEHHRLVAVDDDPVFQVPAHRALHHLALHVLPQGA